jgi:M6 family metalloprotease-like protein
MDRGVIAFGLALGGVATGACRPAPVDGRAAAESEPPLVALTQTPDNEIGDLSYVAPVFVGASWIGNSPGRWVRVPGLVTGFYAGGGENAELTVNAEVRASDHVSFRVLIDGALADPGELIFKWAGASQSGSRSFSFVKSGLPPGFHLAEVQWFTAAGQSAQVGPRALVIDTNPASGNIGQLAVASAPASDNQTTSSPGWVDVPALTTTVTTGDVRDFKITLSAVAAAGNGRLFVRALVDGAATDPGDVLFDSAPNPNHRGARSFTFKKWDVPAGVHTVKVQWMTDPGGEVGFGARSLAVSAMPFSLNSTGEGGVSSVAVESDEIANSDASWTDLPNLSAQVRLPQDASNLTIHASLSTRATGGAMFAVRALVDGQPTPVPAETVIIRDGASWRSDNLVFTARDLSAGDHEVRLQWRRPGSGTIFLADRALSVQHKKRVGGDHVRPYYAEDGVGQLLAPLWGAKDVIAICLDPVVEVPMVSQASMNAIMNQVVAWYAEASLGRFALSNLTIKGCADSGPDRFTAAPDKRGDYYWKNTGQFYRDAIQMAADSGFDFARYDSNGNGQLDGTELVVVTVRPQLLSGWGDRGFAQRWSDGGPQGLSTVEVIEIFFDPPPTGAMVSQIGLVAHEIMHNAARATDMYGAPMPSGRFSLMDDHNGATHLDPLHRIKLGWSNPKLVPLRPGFFFLRQAATTGEAAVLYDPARGDREYFVIENRWKGSSFDGGLSSEGLVVWHILEDHAAAKPIAPDAGWGRYAVRLRTPIALNPGTGQMLVWADGQKSGVMLNGVDPTDNAFVELKPSF